METIGKIRRRKLVKNENISEIAWSVQYRFAAANKKIYGILQEGVAHFEGLLSW